VKKFLLILLVMNVIFIQMTGMGEDSVSKKSITAIASPHSVYTTSFFEARSFSYGANQEPKVPEPKVWGAVVPHHLLAYKLIDGVFSKIALHEPDTIVLIGPNHFNQGARLLTTHWGWQTPFGIVESDQAMIDSMVKAQLVQINEGVFQGEHSIGNLMPFIKFYLPKTRVVPIILHHDVTRKEAAELGKYIAGLMEGKNYLIMASVDFSHYLTRKEAESKDWETLEALVNNNMGKIFSMGNDYLDSPASIGVLFSAMDELDKEFKLLENTNSGVILNNDLIETTSYFTLIFKE